MRLLLDSHLARALAERLRCYGVDAMVLSDWKEGNYRNASDEELLLAAHADRRVLVTFDCRTIPLVLRKISETGQHHGGVVLVSSRSFRANDLGGLLSALLALNEQMGGDDWEDRSIFLRS